MSCINYVVRIVMFHIYRLSLNYIALFINDIKTQLEKRGATKSIARLVVRINA